MAVTLQDLKHRERFRVVFPNGKVGPRICERIVGQEAGSARRVDDGRILALPLNQEVERVVDDAIAEEEKTEPAFLPKQRQPGSTDAVGRPFHNKGGLF